MWSKREEDLWSFRQFIISECVVLLLCCGGWREEPGGGVCKSQFVAWTASFAHPYCTQTRNSPAARLPVLHPALYLDLSWVIFQMFGARQHIRRSHREGCLQEVKKMTKISASVLFLPLNGETWAGTEVLTFLKANRWANRWPPWAFHVVTVTSVANINTQADPIGVTLWDLLENVGTKCVKTEESKHWRALTVRSYSGTCACWIL